MRVQRQGATARSKALAEFGGEGGAEFHTRCASILHAGYRDTERPTPRIGARPELAHFWQRRIMDILDGAAKLVAASGRAGDGALLNVSTYQDRELERSTTG